jgi:quercetin dioxygenase-like cupin family protein
MPRPLFVSPEERSTHNIFPGVHVHAAAGDKVSLSLAVFEPHAIVERHAHPHEQVGMVIEGSALFQVGDDERVLRPGDMYFIPGGVPHRVVAEAAGLQALDVFHPVREEYL